jgi:hypothetical protein
MCGVTEMAFWLGGSTSGSRCGYGDLSFASGRDVLHICALHRGDGCGNSTHRAPLQTRPRRAHASIHEVKFTELVGRRPADSRCKRVLADDRSGEGLELHHGCLADTNPTPWLPKYSYGRRGGRQGSITVRQTKTPSDAGSRAPYLPLGKEDGSPARGSKAVFLSFLV